MLLGGQSFELHNFVTRFPRESSVLAAQFKFFAYLTYDRNYVCSKKIKDIFPLDILLAYIKKIFSARSKQASSISSPIHIWTNGQDFTEKCKRCFLFMVFVPNNNLKIHYNLGLIWSYHQRRNHTNTNWRRWKGRDYPVTPSITYLVA